MIFVSAIEELVLPELVTDTHEPNATIKFKLTSPVRFDSSLFWISHLVCGSRIAVVAVVSGEMMEFVVVGINDSS